MDAVSTLNPLIKMDALLRHYDFDGVSRYGTMIRSCCKLHGGNNPSGFVVNTRNNLWYCHTGDCGGGDAYTLVQKLENCSFNEAVLRIAEIFRVDIANLEILERKSAYMEEMMKWVHTMSARRHKQLEEYTIEGTVRAVAKFRDFQPSTIQHFGLQYVEQIHLKNRNSKSFYLKNRLLFPIYFKHTLLGVSLRRIKPTDTPKWLHQPTEIETKEILYNYDATFGVERIVIVEGIVDVWAYHEIGITAVGTFGAHLTEEQYRLLMRTGAELVWSYDGDSAGQMAKEKAIKQFRHKADQYVVHFEEHEDPASIPREELLKRYGERTRCH